MSFAAVIHRIKTWIPFKIHKTAEENLKRINILFLILFFYKNRKLNDNNGVLGFWGFGVLGYKGQLVTYGIGLLAAIVVYSQIVSLQKQLQVQTLVEYSKQWNSTEMVKKRKVAMEVLKVDDVMKEVAEGDLDKLEQVLELLEDFSTLAEDGVLDEELVWESSLGWYASRYCYYSNLNRSIAAARKKWGLGDVPDDTYYVKLEALYNRYLNNEVKRLNVEKKCIEDGYSSHKDKFIEAEHAGDE